MRSSLEYSKGTALCSWSDSLHDGTGAYKAFRNIQIVDIHIKVVVCVCDGRLQKLLEMLTSSFWCVSENCHSGVSVFTSDEVENDLNLSGSDAYISQVSFCFNSKILLSAYFPLFDVLEPAWPL